MRPARSLAEPSGRPRSLSASATCTHWAGRRSPRPGGGAGPGRPSPAGQTPRAPCLAAGGVGFPRPCRDRRPDCCPAGCHTDGDAEELLPGFSAPFRPSGRLSGPLGMKARPRSRWPFAFRSAASLQVSSHSTCELTPRAALSGQEGTGLLTLTLAMAPAGLPGLGRRPALGAGGEGQGAALSPGAWASSEPGWPSFLSLVTQSPG